MRAREGARAPQRNRTTQCPAHLVIARKYCRSGRFRADRNIGPTGYELHRQYLLPAETSHIDDIGERQEPFGLHADAVFSGLQFDRSIWRFADHAAVNSDDRIDRRRSSNRESSRQTAHLDLEPHVRFVTNRKRLCFWELIREL